MFEQPAMVTTSAEAAMAANILRKIYFPRSVDALSLVGG
jgi:hypothetical protein